MVNDLRVCARLALPNIGPTLPTTSANVLPLFTGGQVAARGDVAVWRLVAERRVRSVIFKPTTTRNRRENWWSAVRALDAGAPSRVDPSIFRRRMVGCGAHASRQCQWSVKGHDAALA